MKTASLKEIKNELEQLPQPELVKLCLRLIKFKKETKEFSSYLLFNAADEEAYILGVQNIVGELFEQVNSSNQYICKKNLRKIVRLNNRYINYSDEVTTEVELLIYFCTEFNRLKLSFRKSAQILNIYQSQVKKIKNRIESLHEDLQYDYEKRLAEL